ncbi:MAG: hypothetical protein ACLTMP_06070, partial [Eggerthella lenta]
MDATARTTMAVQDIDAICRMRGGSIMATNEPLNSAADEVAAAEAELKAAQEKLEAAKAKLAATTSDDACDVEKETVAAVVVDEATGEVEAVVVEDVAVVSCDAGSEDK